MLLIGAHMSIAGGIHKALLRGAELGCTTIQVFIRSNMAWNPGRLTVQAAEKYRLYHARTAIKPVVAHGCYLVNLAATDGVTLARSLEATAGELKRAELLGIPYLVIHPGAHMGAGEAAGIRKIARNLDEVFRAAESSRVKVLLETTAGAGTVLGSRFEQLAEVIAQSGFPERLGVCYDTCHTFAAGYDIRTKRAYSATMRQFDRTIGLERLLCFHFNDALKPLGSRRDRHTHIGHGEIGEAGFAHLLKDARFTDVPKLLETPKGTYRRRPWDRINLDTLRRLAADGHAGT